MPRYFYDVNDGREMRDDEGMEASGRKEARAHATHLLSDRAQEADRLTSDGDAVAVDVRDDAGNHIVTARIEVSIKER